MNWLSQLSELPTVQAVGWTLFHSVWQGLALALLSWCALLVFRRASARRRYQLAYTTLLLCALLPACTLGVLLGQAADVDAPIEREKPSPLPTSEDSRIVVETPQASGGRQPIERAEQFPSRSETQSIPSTSPSAAWSWTTLQSHIEHASPYLVAVWIVGVWTAALRFGFAWFRVQRLRTEGISDVDPQLLNRMRLLAERMNVRRPVELKTSSRVTVPTIVGWLKPLILLPATAATGLSAAQLESLMAHELAHVRRGDYLANLIQNGIETLLFYHPAVWWISRKVRTERENCCDDLATQVCGDEVAYATALLKMEELRSDNRVALAAGDGNLLDRVKRLLGRPSERHASGWAGLAVAVAVLCVFGIVLTAVPTVHAERNEEQTETELTPVKIAEQVEAAMNRFDSVEFTAKTKATRNAGRFGRGEVIPVSGEGDLLYRSDGKRWFVDSNTFTVSLGQAGAVPRREISGFDGKWYFKSDRDEILIVGEESSANRRYAPRKLFWHAAKTDGWLLAALKHWTAKVKERKTVNGREQVVVVADVGKLKPDETQDNQRTVWHYEITLSPSQSWLPIATKVSLQGKLYAQETITDLAQTPDHVWYPKTIRFEQFAKPYFGKMKEIIEVTSFRLRRDFVAEEFQFQPPLGYSVKDYEQGRAWTADPWWPELVPWLMKEVNWPPPLVGGLHELKSYLKDEKNADGRDAPPITASEWLGKRPAGWNDANRKLTVVVFFGGRLIQPTPEWLSALKALHQRYAKHGLEMVGVGTADAGVEQIRATRDALSLPFPVAVDMPSEVKGQYGKTSAAFGLRSYAGVVLVDAQGKIRTLENVKPPVESIAAPIEYAVRQALKGDAKFHQPFPRFPQLSRKQIDKIDAEWKRRRQAKAGKAMLSGTVHVAIGGRDKFGTVPVEGFIEGAPVEISAVPTLKFLSSNTMAGHFNFKDYDNAIKTTTDNGKFTLPGLRKGTYELTIRPVGLAAVERTVYLADDDSELNFEITLHQGHDIRGTIVDANGKPIVGASIKTTRRHFDPERMQRHTTAHLPRRPVFSNERGQFRFKNLHVGSYSMQVSADGFKTKDVEPTAAGVQSLKVVLEREQP